MTIGECKKLEKVLMIYLNLIIIIEPEPVSQQKREKFIETEWQFDDFIQQDEKSIISFIIKKNTKINIRLEEKENILILII